MRLIAISDVHEQWAHLELPAGELLVIAGDLCERADKSFAAADVWLATVQRKFARVLYVPGNHDWSIMENLDKYRSSAPNLLAAMVVDESFEIDGLSFHAMPWDFADRESPEALIPEGLDVLITHEPPQGILDWSPRSRDDRLGNRVLRERVTATAPRLHLFGHCHMAYGVQTIGETTFVNVAICGDPKKYYRSAHPPTIIDIEADSLAITQWR